MAVIRPDLHLFLLTGTNTRKDTSAVNDNDQLLTIDEAAELLRTPVATLRWWRHCGTGPRSFKIGRGVRYLRSEVTGWLREQAASTGHD
jgi:excisionase family DNA binding protein